MFMHPVPGPITSPYGPRGRGFHNGIDYGWLFADPQRSRNIYAPASGTVTVGWNALVGNYIELPTERGMLRLAHFASIAVKSGDSVVQGRTLLGVMGQTGLQAQGVHLHVDLFMKDGRVDPEPHFTVPFQVLTASNQEKTMRVIYNKDSTDDATRRALVGELSFQVITAAQSLREEKLWGAPVNFTVGEWNAARDLVELRRKAVGLPASGGGGGFTVEDRTRLNAVPTAEQNGAAARTAIVK
jgi:murein DD-endopeptidase MepM/ murein hydrolase activator NlpD